MNIQVLCKALYKKLARNRVFWQCLRVTVKTRMAHFSRKRAQRNVYGLYTVLCARSPDSMNATMQQHVHVEFDLLGLLASQSGLDRHNLSQHVRVMVALFLYEHQRISLGKACELGGISQWEFADLNRQFQIPTPYSDHDLADEMQRLAHV